MRLLAKSLTINAGVETTEGVDVNPSQAIQTSELSITPLGGPTEDRNLDDPSLGNEIDVLIGTFVELTFKVELAGSGVAGTRPAYGDLLLACGMSEVISAGTSVTYGLVSTAFDSVTIHFWLDGQKHFLLGARGSMTLELSPGIPHLAFNFMGLYKEPISEATPARDYSGVVPALPINNTHTPTFTLHGQSLVMEELTCDLAIEREYRNVVGGESIPIYDRAPAGSVTFETVPISTKNWFETARLNTLDAMQLIHGTTAGNIVTLSAPKVQLVNPRYGGDNISTTIADLRYIRDAGDDEISLVYT